MVEVWRVLVKQLRRDMFKDMLGRQLLLSEKDGRALTKMHSHRTVTPSSSSPEGGACAVVQHACPLYVL